MCNLSGTIFEGNIILDITIKLTLFRKSIFLSPHSTARQIFWVIFSGRHFNNAIFKRRQIFLPHSAAGKIFGNIREGRFLGFWRFFYATFQREGKFFLTPNFVERQIFEATFTAWADFSYAVFGGEAYFLKATFSGRGKFFEDHI